MEEGHRDGIVAMDAAWQPFLQSVATLLAARREMGGQRWVSTSHPHGLVLLCAVGVVCLVLEHFLGL